MRELLVGDHLDRYEITDLLARSGMAAIYRARDTETGESVALKVPHFQFESDVVFHERFRREEALGQRLAHPAIIKFLPPREKSRMYIAMELVEGTSLRALLAPQKPMATERALDIARQLCEALVYLHAERVVHRDLKPENVLVLADGRVKLLDFGIALDESARRLTWFGLSSTVGTPDYMAPEQASGRRGDARSDVYALGTILYEMLTGHLPYASTNAAGMVRAKAVEPPEPPSRHVPGLDPRLEDIVLHAIEPSPRSRYATAAAMLEDLADPARVVPGARAVSPARRGFASIPLPRGVLGGIAVVLVLSGLVLLTWLSDRNGAPAEPKAPAGRGSVR
jgi:eukaryotic-like serine/threonine-protein kinase